MTGTTRRTVFPTIAMAAVLCLSACARTPEQQAPPQHVVYDCESGRTVHARYLSRDEAVVEYGGRTMDMRIAVSASGARYVEENMEWWTKGTGPGSTGTMFRHENGVTGEAVDTCAVK